MQDTITKEITVKAPKERVYKAISDVQELTKWFPEQVEGSYEVGKTVNFIFTSMNHKTSVYVEAAKPSDYFSFRWVPGSTGMVGDVMSTPNTLVEFTLEEMGDETKVTVKESGFSKLPAEVAEKSFKDNSGGWPFMMGRLEKLFNQS